MFWGCKLPGIFLLAQELVDTRGGLPFGTHVTLFGVIRSGAVLGWIVCLRLQIPTGILSMIPGQM